MLRKSKNDVLNYIEENVEIADYEDREELGEKLNDDCWVDDSVTGNASGSYYCNAYRAEQAIGNIWEDEILIEACHEFGGDLGEWIEKGAEFCDVCIRCYLLGEAIAEALDELDIDEVENENGYGYHLEYVNRETVTA